MTARFIPLLSVCATLGLATSGPAAEPPPGHSNHGEAFNEGPRQAARLLQGVDGIVSFPVTTKSPETQRFFDQGVCQLHGFWYFEAERSFRQAAAIDPDCAMAYWGMAMANRNNEDRARGFLSKAVALKDQASPKEQLWIASLENYFPKEDKRSKTDRALAYISDLETIVQEHPQDVEAKAFLAWSIWAHKRDAPLSSHQAVDALLEQVFAANPMHPAHHYRIHLWDGKKPARALPSCAVGGQTAPGIAHLWHMPGHIYSKLKRFDDAVWQQEASSRVDHRHMIDTLILPDQIHNYAHNEEWLVRNYAELGRAHDGIALAKSLIEIPRHPKYNSLDKSSSSASYGRTRLISTLLTWELWDDLIALNASPYLEAAVQTGHEVTRHRALAVAYFHQQQSDDLKASIAAL
jgi:tetratricopeptide (TPR) repeat protein